MIDRVAGARNMAMKLHSPRTTILIENTAGSAGEMGYAPEQERAVLECTGDAR